VWTSEGVRVAVVVVLCFSIPEASAALARSFRSSAHEGQ
jgi:hypothetical protein